MDTITKRTAAEASERSGISPKLIRAVIKQTGRENLEDIMRHGCDAGFAGLTYYSDTVAFYKRNRAAILELAKQQADDFGTDVISMIAGFNYLKSDDPQHKRELMDEIGRTLYGQVTDDPMNVANALTWYAAEEVARAMCDE